MGIIAETNGKEVMAQKAAELDRMKAASREESLARAYYDKGATDSMGVNQMALDANSGSLARSSYAPDNSEEIAYLLSKGAPAEQVASKFGQEAVMAVANKMAMMQNQRQTGQANPVGMD